MNQQNNDKGRGVSNENQGNRHEQGNAGESDYGKSGGNAGAGKSGKEDMGSEKPSDGGAFGSNKPGSASE
jgi:hypothetical protein